MKYTAAFQCAAGCPGQHALTEVIYRCPRCEGLLEVVHDSDALRARAPAAWMRLFDERYGRTQWPYGSGVWSKLEWVLPEVDPANVVSLFEGNSNLLWAERFGRQIGLEDLWVKQCGISHTGSFKDLGMTVLVSAVKQAIAEGRSIRALACASTGDTSAALAAYGAAAGIPVVVLLPAGKISAAQLIQPVAHGAIVCSLDTDFDGCMRVVQRLTTDPQIYLANSMNSLRVEGQKTVAIEVVQQFEWEVPDWVLVPGGNLGNTAALAKGFLQLRELGLTSKLPRLVCCQAEHASPLYQAFARARAAGRSVTEDDYRPVTAQATLASAIQIGAPVSLPKAVRGLVACDGLAMQASEQELADAAARADRTGMFNCPHTGVALACLIKLVNAGTIGRRDRVVVISTAHGLKFTEFKARYHEQRLGFASPHANRPVELPADPERAVAALHRVLDAAP
ncbi:MAG: threonine synthase [Myxococcales bacterium]|nr:threonine synthase [Myxococcales bacterium]